MSERNHLYIDFVNFNHIKNDEQQPENRLYNFVSSLIFITLLKIINVIHFLI